MADPVVSLLDPLHTPQTFTMRLLGMARYTEGLCVVLGIRPAFGQGHHVITNAGFGVAAILETHDTQGLLLE
jgi:hypothetical protein